MDVQLAFFLSVGSIDDYIVGVVCEYVAVKEPALSKECISIIIRDIEEELKRYHDAGQFLGMECDERTWLRLLERLKRA